jgi:acyl-CoA synthetase (AMP-forming)/AMP-acid ligase II
LIPPVLTDACSLYSGALKYFSATCRKMEPLFPDVKPFVGKQEDAGVEAWPADQTSPLEVEELLPRTPSGKVLRREIRDRYWADRARQVN